MIKTLLQSHRKPIEHPAVLLNLICYGYDIPSLPLWWNIPLIAIKHVSNTEPYYTASNQVNIPIKSYVNPYNFEDPLTVPQKNQ